MNDFSNRFRFILRWLLVAGVLAGLCFSSSEGVQLLPFPAAAGERATSDVSVDGGKLKSYSQSVHNSAANLGTGGGNIQKNVKFFDDGSRISRKPQFRKTLRSFVVRDKFEPTFFKNAALASAPSDRAPPVA